MDFPAYTAGERIADSVVHVLGIVASLAASITLIVISIVALPVLTTIAVAIYGAGLLMMVGFSAGYNLVPPTRAKEILRRLDHAAIFVMIAGSYTPFVLVSMPGAWGISLLAVVWSVAALGIVMKLGWPGRFARTSLALYLAQGWAILAAVVPLAQSVSLASLILIGAGGVLYTVGVGFHLWRRLPYHNAVWHALVLVAAGCHYAAVVDTVIA